jgi:hypothetical protein
MVHGSGAASGGSIHILEIYLGIQRLRFLVSNDTALFTEMMGGFMNLALVGCHKEMLRGSVVVVSALWRLLCSSICWEVSGI